MNDLEIKRHSFELAKNRLKEFSKNTDSKLEIDRVRTDGGFLGLGDHKVTGYELNRRLKTIQECFIAVNTNNIKVIKEFRAIYNALDVLDRDYITSIVANVKAIEKTSNDVRAHQKTLKHHNYKLEAHQTEIEKNVSNISRLVNALQVFQKKLETYNHLTDIDKIWNDCQNWYSEMQKLSSIVSNIESTCTEHAEAITIAKDHIESLLSFKNDLMATTHLQDIDSMWNSLMAARSDLDNLQNDLTTINKHIDNFMVFVDSISEYDHLEDIDIMWHKIEDYGNNLDSLNDYKQDLLSIIHLKDVDELWDISEKHSNQMDELQKKDEELMKLIQCNKESVDQNLANEKEKNDTTLQKLNKKINYAYWVVGGSIALALVELLVIFLR